MFKTTRFGRVGFATAASSVVASLFCMDAVAAPQASPERIALREASALHALGGSTLPVLDRRAGPGNTVTAERVFNALASTSFAPGSTVVAMRSVAAAAPFGEHVMAHGPSWLLDVGSEGQYVRFTAKQPGVGVPFDERPSYDAVVALGRAATSGELASLVPLGPDESLEPVSVSYVQNAVFTSDGHEEREVIQSRVLFARAVAGVAVVGGGSTVRAGFDNSGQLVDIRIDWSSLERTTTTQATELVELAQRKNCVLQVGHVERFNPVFNYLEAVATEPRFIEAHNWGSGFSHSDWQRFGRTPIERL